MVEGPRSFKNFASAGAVRGGKYPTEAFAKGGDSDECRSVPSPSVIILARRKCRYCRRSSAVCDINPAKIKVDVVRSIIEHILVSFVDIPSSIFYIVR